LGPTFRWYVAEARAAPRFGVALGLLLAVALIYWPSTQALAGLWTDTRIRAYTHGFPVLLTSIWLLSRRRTRLEAQPLRPQPMALGAVAMASSLWLIAWRASIQDLELLLLPALVLSASLAALGWPLTREIAFPVGFLCFALPIWSDLVGPLQWLSVTVVAALVWLTGLPAYVHEDLIELPAGTLAIAGGCSGLHYLVVGLAFAAFYGEMRASPLRRRLEWLALMGAIALAANWVRIFTIAVAGFATDMHTFLVRVDHYWFGWLVFAAGLALFLWLAERRERHRGGPLASKRAPAQRSAAGNAASRTCWIEVLVCMAALPMLAYARDAGRPPTAATITIAWPAAPPGWSGPLPDRAPDWKPAFHNATAAGVRRYIDAGGRLVELLEVAYLHQRQGAELVAYDNSVLGDPDSVRLLGERIVHTAAGEWREDTASDGGGGVYVIWSRYRIGQRTFVRPIASQIAYGLSDLFTRPLSSLMALRAACDPRCSEARSALETAARLTPGLRLLPQRRGD
jgi:EpsI family protein